MTTPASTSGSADGAQALPKPAPQSAAAPSPFPPIADYAFLSNCHTAALVAPDGGIGWLCVPSFDAPSVFGTLLDRQGGYFRLGPFGTNVPSARAYEPGTNTLVTTWHVAERVGGRPRRAHARPAARRGHRHAALAAAVRRRRRPPAGAHGRVHRGQRRHGPRVRARVRLRPRARRLDAGRRRPPHGRRERRRPDHPPPHGHAARDRGRPRARPPAAAPGRAPVLLPVVGRGPRLARPTSPRRRSGSPPRRGSGGRGSDGRGSPTTAGASRSSARRSPSRA